MRVGSNIRRRGEDVEAGDILAKWGERLGPAQIALLGAQGRCGVAVRRRPRVLVLSTGSELRGPGERLGASAIYDANRPLLMALAAQAGAEVIDGGIVGDDPASLAAAFAAAAERADLIVTSGGASVGGEDHSASAFASLGGAFRVLRIAMKPGKPAVVGRLGSAAYLGLPGNPGAALVSWLILAARCWPL